MPQLDQFTYLTQFVWLCVFYMSFYVLLYNELPLISRILKLRTLLVSKVTSGGPRITAFLNPQDVVLRTLQSSVAYMYSSVSAASDWCKSLVSRCNADQLEGMNKAYVSALGEIMLSKGIKQSALETISPRPALSRAGFTPPARTFHQIYVLRAQQRMFLLRRKKAKKT
jgi:F-type H+-transporting ATPase subunit b